MASQAPDHTTASPENPSGGGPTGTRSGLTDAGRRAMEDPAYRAAVVDLLGAIAYGELSAFERLVEDAKLAPGIEDKIAIGAMAAAEFGHLQKLVGRLAELGADPAEAMQAFRASFDSFHAHTAPADYYEGLIKAYVGDGLAADFYREIAAYLDPETREVIISSLEDAGQTAFIVERVRAGIAEDHRLGGRLALWGRRLMGEALLAGGVDRPGLDLAALGRMFTRLTERHAARMAELGLDS
jgi:hypothetical protein